MSFILNNNVMKKNIMFFFLMYCIACQNNNREQNLDTVKIVESMQIDSNQFKEQLISPQWDTMSLPNKLITLYKYQNQIDKNVVDFFYLIPNTYNAFVCLYGYKEQDDSVIFSPLYNCAQEHLNFLCTTKIIDDEAKLNKFIHIGINGKWEADAVGQMQSCLLNLIINNPNKATNILDTIAPKQVISFWYFLFDGPHPSNKKKDFEKLYGLILPINKVQAGYLKWQYEVLLKAEEHSN